MNFLKVAVAATAIASLAAAVGARAAVPTGAPVDGIRCEQMEMSGLHIHQHLAIFDHGRPLQVPADVGRPLAAQCFYWLHTHTPDGIIHVESPTVRTFTLGNFFDVWGQPLTRRNVAGAKTRSGEQVVVWVDGRRYTADPRGIELTQHLDVTIEVGAPIRKPAPFTDWQGN